MPPWLSTQFGQIDSLLYLEDNCWGWVDRQECNCCVERHAISLWNALLPTRENSLLITSSATYYWLHVHFVLGAAPGFSVKKPAVQYKYHNTIEWQVCWQCTIVQWTNRHPFLQGCTKEGPAIRGKLWMREYARRPEEKPFLFHVWLAENWIGQRYYLAADVCKKLLTVQENCSENRIAHKICSQWASLLWAKICSINLHTENQFRSQRIIDYPSIYL